MKTYVINLDRSPGRLAHMAAQLRRLGVPFERVPAIDGRQLRETDRVGRPTLSATESGCFLSHRSAWGRIAKGQDPYGIVLEDDVHIAPGFAALAVSTEWIPPDADIVKFKRC
jgi:glycosyl transferase family 25